MVQIKKDEIVITIPTGGDSKEYHEKCVVSMLHLIQIMDTSIEDYTGSLFYITDMLQSMIRTSE
ncbi:MAG: hypothetical protein RIC03_06900 [Cyclobacteriaceae bacterium]